MSRSSAGKCGLDELLDQGLDPEDFGRLCPLFTESTVRGELFLASNPVTRRFGLNKERLFSEVQALRRLASGGHLDNPNDSVFALFITPGTSSWHLKVCPLFSSEPKPDNEIDILIGWCWEPSGSEDIRALAKIWFPKVLKGRITKIEAYESSFIGTTGHPFRRLRRDDGDEERQIAEEERRAQAYRCADAEFAAQRFGTTPERVKAVLRASSSRGRGKRYDITALNVLDHGCDPGGSIEELTLNTIRLRLLKEGESAEKEDLALPEPGRAELLRGVPERRLPVFQTRQRAEAFLKLAACLADKRDQAENTCCHALVRAGSVSGVPYFDVVSLSSDKNTEPARAFSRRAAVLSVCPPLENELMRQFRADSSIAERYEAARRKSGLDEKTFLEKLRKSETSTSPVVRSLSDDALKAWLCLYSKRIGKQRSD